MNKISKVTVNPLQNPIYFKPLTMHFTHNGIKRTWDLLALYDNVAIVIYNVTRGVLILVKQFRPAVYYGSIPETDRQLRCQIDIKKYPPEIGITIELCTGVLDKKVPLPEMAKNRILEECGYDVCISSLEQIGSCCSLVGISGRQQTLFYCEVTDDMKTSCEGSVEEQIVNIIEMSVDEVKKYMSQFNIKSPPSFMFGMYWFLYNKVK